MSVEDKITTKVFIEMMDDHLSLNKDLKAVMINEYACCHLAELGWTELATAMRVNMRELCEDES